MSFRELSVPGAWEITPQLRGDRRFAFAGRADERDVFALFPHGGEPGYEVVPLDAFYDLLGVANRHGGDRIRGLRRHCGVSRCCW